MADEGRRIEIDGQPLFRDRQGEPIWTAERYSELFTNADYKRVAQDTVGDYLISTVWTGAVVCEGDEPMLFQTGVFDRTKDLEESFGLGRLVEERGYGTEAEAIAGHQVMVTLAHALAGVRSS